MLLVLGVIGLVLLGISFFLDDLFESVLELDGGWLSVPALGAFLTALGFVGWAASDALGSTSGGILAGIAAGLVLGGVAVALVRLLRGGTTDATPRTTDFEGKPARVLTPVPAGGLGEVVLHHLGARVKVSARAETAHAIPAGAPVRVVAVESDTLVVVEPEADFWFEAGAGRTAEQDVSRETGP